MRTRTNNIGNGLPSQITNPAPNTIAICIAMGFIFNFLKIRVSGVRLTAGCKQPLPSLRSGCFASLASFAGWSAPGHHLAVPTARVSLEIVTFQVAGK